MSENETKDEKTTLDLSRPGRLELKKTVQSGQVRQSFSHGRSKTVQVEVKKRRTFTRGETGRMAEVKAQDVLIAPAPVVEAEADVEEGPVPATPTRTLTEQEKAAPARPVARAPPAEKDPESGG